MSDYDAVRALRHALYRNHEFSPDSCSGCVDGKHWIERFDAPERQAKEASRGDGNVIMTARSAALGPEDQPTD